MKSMVEVFLHVGKIDFCHAWQAYCWISTHPTNGSIFKLGVSLVEVTGDDAKASTLKH